MFFFIYVFVISCPNIFKIELAGDIQTKETSVLAI